MTSLIRTVLFAVCSSALLSASAFPQKQPESLPPNDSITFSVAPGDSRSFRLIMKQDGFAEISWRANDNVGLRFSVTDGEGREVSSGQSTGNDSTMFVATKDGEYSIRLHFDKTSEAAGTQNISVQYQNTFKLPAGTKQKDIRKINGYDVRIMNTPQPKDGFGYSYVLVEKNGRLKNVLKSEGGGVMGFSFAEDMRNAYTPKARRGTTLLKAVRDATGDGIPDVMVNYYSGGAHCCFESYFISLGETAEIVERVATDNAELVPIRKSPNGGLIFETADNAFAYWLTSFAESPMPTVIMEFKDNKLRPNFDLMKKPPPPMTALRAKALAARSKIGNDPYTGEESGIEYPFWGEMLDLIYSGNKGLAWQYFDLVWPAGKQDKELFRRDFKNRLAESYYGKR